MKDFDWDDVRTDPNEEPKEERTIACLSFVPKAHGLIARAEAESLGIHEGIYLCEGDNTVIQDYLLRKFGLDKDSCGSLNVEPIPDEVLRDMQIEGIA